MGVGWQQGGRHHNEPDDPAIPDFQQNVPVHSKIFMIDGPGVLTGPNNDLNINVKDKIYAYENFTTHVEFNGVRASDDFKWHVVTKLNSDFVDGRLQWVLATPQNYGSPHTTLPPDDCSSQP